MGGGGKKKKWEKNFTDMKRNHDTSKPYKISRKTQGCPSTVLSIELLEC